MSDGRTSARPRLLDLFCCAGGCSDGYSRAGFEVFGVDIEPQPNYPFEFCQADALVVLESLLAGGTALWPYGLGDFDVIHASPPCQAYSPLNAYNHKIYPDLVEPVRALLRATGIPYVIENVMQAPLVNPMMLCGSMFGLKVYRHRGFESSMALMAPFHSRHVARCIRNGYLPAVGQNMTISGGKHSAVWQRKACEVMGTPWMRTIREVCEAIPPAYTEWIGRYLMAALAHEEIAA